MTDDPTRRDALAGAAALVAAAGAALAAPREARAQASDATALNRLLTAEYRLVRAYDVGIGILGSPPVGDPDQATAPVLLAVARHFQAQHRDHAARLAQAVAAVGGTPAREATVLFTAPAGFTVTVMNVLRLAANEEKAAAIAYADALKSLGGQANAQVAAAIGGVEAQHFTLLHLVANGVVAPNMMTALMASETVPRAFVAAAGAGAVGLDTLAPFTYGAG